MKQMKCQMMNKQRKINRKVMDDTVILATPREKCLKKLEAVLNFCDEYGMEINEKKYQILRNQF